MLLLVCAASSSSSKAHCCRSEAAALSLVQHCQTPKAEEGILLDTCPRKTTAGFAVREKPSYLSCPQDQTDKEGCWKFFFVLTSGMGSFGYFI